MICCPSLGGPRCKRYTLEWAKINMKRCLSSVCCFVSSSLLFLESEMGKKKKKIKAADILDDYFSRPLNQHFLIRYQVPFRSRLVFWERRGCTAAFPRQLPEPVRVSEGLSCLLRVNPGPHPLRLDQHTSEDEH